MRITKNTTISIGLGVALAVFIFWFGTAYGVSKQRMDTHELLPHHEGTVELLDGYMPRKEVETNFISIEKQLDKIQETQEKILFKLNE